MNCCSCDGFAAVSKSFVLLRLSIFVSSPASWFWLILDSFSLGYFWID